MRVRRIICNGPFLSPVVLRTIVCVQQTAVLYDVVHHTITTTPMNLRRTIDCAASSRRVWSAQEDDAIRELVKKHGTSRWTLIADSLALDYHTRGRSGKQCWERWHNHLGGNGTSRRTYTPRSRFSVFDELSSSARLKELEIVAGRTVLGYIFEGGDSEFALE